MLLKLTVYNANEKFKGASIVINMDTITYITKEPDGGTTILLTPGIWKRFTESMEDIEMMMNYGAEKGLVFVSEKRW